MNQKKSVAESLRTMLEIFGGQNDDDGNNGYWEDGQFFPCPEIDIARQSLCDYEISSIKVSKLLAKNIAAMGYTFDESQMSHGHALEVVAKVAGLPNWDALSGVLKSKGHFNTLSDAPIQSRGSRSLYISGSSLASSDGLSGSPDVIVTIDENALWAAAKVLHDNKPLLDSVTINVDYEISDIESGEDVCPSSACIEITSINQDGSPRFGMFALSEKHTDIKHTKGLFFDQKNFGDCSPAVIAREDGGKFAIFIDHNNEMLKCSFNEEDRFSTSNNDAVEVISFVSDDLVKQMRLSREDIASSDLILLGACEPDDDRKKELTNAGYSFHVSDFKRPYWALNDEASEDFNTDQEAIDAAHLDFTKESRADD